MVSLSILWRMLKSFLISSSVSSGKSFSEAYPFSGSSGWMLYSSFSCIMLVPLVTHPGVRRALSMPSVCHQTTRPKRAALMQERGRCTRFWVTGSLNLSTEDGWGGMNEYLIALLFWEGGDIMQMGHGLCFSIQFCQLITNPPGFPTSIFKEPNFCLLPHPPSNIPSAVSHNPKFIF